MSKSNLSIYLEEKKLRVNVLLKLAALRRRGNICRYYNKYSRYHPLIECMQVNIGKAKWITPYIHYLKIEGIPEGEDKSWVKKVAHYS